MSKFFVTLAFVCVSVLANAECGGTCVGTSDNQYYNSACQGASVNGQQACENYSGLGCVWQAQVQTPGQCVGTSDNQYYNSACQGASVNGQQACQNYSGLGCAWVPASCQ